MTLRVHLVLVVVLMVAACAALGEPMPADELRRVKADEADRVAAIEKVRGAVVCMYGRAVGRGGGSGVLIHPDGFVLTNYHVVRAAGRSGKAGLADGNLYDWDLYGMDPGGDLALVRLKGKDVFPAAPLGDSGAVRPGDWALAMGNPFALAEDHAPTVTLGIVSGVERFQHGQGGGRTLVYGNCIQIDTSINPGNSGGPLFDIRGRLIGINGRGSFEERGRVNVGVGYAISIEQAKNFLPDLLATKVCEHATLDATFVYAGGKVICDAVNLDSPVGELGLRPGDELLALDGRPVRTANRLLNLITTYPARWPVEVTFRHGGKEVSGWLRLTPLPYGQIARRPVPVRPRVIPGKKKEDEEEGKTEDRGPDEDAEGKEGAGGKKKSASPPDDAKPKPKPPERPPAKPGQIMEPERNREACRWLLERYVEFLGGRAALARSAAVECEETASVEGRPPLRRRRLVAADGRFRIETLAAETQDNAWGWDGERFWHRPGEAEGSDPNRDEAAPKRTDAAIRRAMAALAAKKPLDGFQEVELEGGDRACRRRAFRLRVRQADGPACLFWFSVLDGSDRFEVRLLKAALDSESKGADRAWTFGDYRTVDGLRVPHRVRLVRGLEERVEREYVVSACKVLGTVPDGAFRPAPSKVKRQ